MNIKSNISIEKVSKKKNLFLIILLLSLLLNIFKPELYDSDIVFYAQGAKAMSDGNILYKDYGDVKPPGVFFIYYSVIKIAGENNVFLGLKVLSILFQVLSAYVLYLLLKRFFSVKTSFYTTIFFLFSLHSVKAWWHPSIFLMHLLPLFISFYFLTSNDFNLKPKNIFLSALFLGLGFLLSTNLVIYFILYPILLYRKHRNVIKTILYSLICLTGFIIPFLLALYYFWYKSAIDDFIWWNFKWASIYGSFYPLWLRIWKFFYGFLLTHGWIPVYVSGFYGLHKIIKNKGFSNNKELFILTVFFCSILARLMLVKGVERYYLFLVPSFILLLPYGYEVFKIKFLRILLVLPLIGFITTTKNAEEMKNLWINWKKERAKVYEYIINNSSQNDKIFVFNNGGTDEIYFFTNRKMATSFPLPGQHLDYPYLWENKNYKGIELPWEKFLSEFERDKPVLFIDPSGDFFNFKDKDRKDKLKYYMDNFINMIKSKYERVFESNGFVIWKRKR